MDTQLVIAVELGYCDAPEAEAFALMLELRKMLNGLRRSLFAKTRRVMS